VFEAGPVARLIGPRSVEGTLPANDLGDRRGRWGLGLGLVLCARPVTTLDPAWAQPAESASLVAVEASGPDCSGIRG